MEVRRIAGVSGVGGIFVNSEIAEAFACTGTITFDWDKLKKADFTRVCSAIEQGFTLTNGGPVKAMLTMLTSIEAAPKVPPIGYMGKKNMNVLVPYSKAEQYKTDLIAAGHMVDLVLDKAVSLRMCQGWDRYLWLNVSAYSVSHHNKGEPEVPAFSRRRHNTGAHLQPATSKLANLVRLWQEELFPLRKPLLEFVKRKPTLTFDLTTGTDI